MEKYKAYNHGLILYPDATDYSCTQVLEYIKNNFSSYAYIKHKPEKEETKIHVHVILKFPNKRYNTSLSKELGVPENYFQKINLNAYLRYLIHYDDEDKIQYSIDDVIGPLKDKLQAIINGKDNEKINLTDILDVINQINAPVSFKLILTYCLENNLFSTYLRYYAIIRDVILEHNQKYLDL